MPASLPTAISCSYNRYKEDTDAFATWLFNTARCIGYEPVAVNAPKSANDPPQTGGRLKGKARKEAKSRQKGNETSSNSAPGTTVKRQMTTKELVVQARLIAASTKPVVKVPLSIQGLLKRAIHARRRCSDWFQQMTKENSSAEYLQSNSGHEHFIAVLEQACKILEPRFELQKPSIRPTTSIKGPSSVDQVISMNNRFESLEIKDTFNAALDIAASETACSFAKASGNNARPPQVCDLGIEEGNDLAFMVYCFYEDIHRLREFIKDTWRQHNDGSIDLCTAALVTNLALELVSKYEEDFKEISPEFDSSSSYHAITSVIRPTPLSSESHDEIWSMFRTTTNDGFVFGYTAMCLFRNVSELEEQREQDCHSYVTPIAAYHTERINDEWAPLPPFENWQEDDKMIAQILLDFRYIWERQQYRTKDEIEKKLGDNERDWSENSRCHQAFQDQITKSLLHILKNLSPDISVSAVFSIQTLLDIQQSLHGHTELAYINLCQRSAEAFNSIDIPFSDGYAQHRPHCKATPERLIEKFGNSACQEAFHLAYLAKSGIQFNKFVLFKQATHKNPETDQRSNFDDSELPEDVRSLGLSLENIWPSDDPTFYYNSNPLYCGMETLRFSVTMHKLGVNMVNEFHSFLGAAHLYNALRQLRFLSSSWEAMDRAIEIYIGPVFKGSLPTEEGEILARTMLTLGIRPEVFAKNKKSNKAGHAPMFKITDKAIIPVSEVATNIIGYLEGTNCVERTLYNLERIMGKAKADKRLATHFERLLQLRDLLPTELNKIDIDLVALNQQSRKLLAIVREAMKSNLGYELQHPLTGENLAEKHKTLFDLFSVCNLLVDAFAGLLGNPELPTVARVVGGRRVAATKQKGIASASSIERAIMGSTNEKTANEQNTHLIVCAEVFREFIQELQARPVVEPFDVAESTRFLSREDYDRKFGIQIQSSSSNTSESKGKMKADVDSYSGQ